MTTNRNRAISIRGTPPARRRLRTEDFRRVQTPRALNGSAGGSPASVARKSSVCRVASVVEPAPGSAGGSPASVARKSSVCRVASVVELAPGSAGGSPASFLLLLSFLLFTSCQVTDAPTFPSSNLQPLDGVTGTFSIAAVDPETGVFGAAVASRYPAVGKVVIYVRAGAGAFCTQHWHNPPWGERALDLLAEGKLPEDVLAELLRDDPGRDKRQLAIIDMKGRAANRNPANADASGVWWGAMSGRYYAAQGNTLTGSEVVIAMARAYEETKGSVADRLMAALVAGDCAGGDHRGRLAAGIRVAKKGVEGDWLELYIDESDDAVIELARKYAALEHAAKGEWRGGRMPFEHPCAKRPEPKPPR